MFGSKIKLDKDLLERCKEHAQVVGYSSVEEFITHALEKELRSSTRIEVGEEREIAKQLNIKSATAGVLLHRARTKLRGVLMPARPSKDEVL